MDLCALPRLIVEAGFTAFNYGLPEEMQTILSALPDLLDDPQLIAGCQALMLLGLNQTQAAEQKTEQLFCDDYLQLRELLATLSR